MHCSLCLALLSVERCTFFDCIVFRQEYCVHKIYAGGKRNSHLLLRIKHGSFPSLCIEEKITGPLQNKPLTMPLTPHPLKCLTTPTFIILIYSRHYMYEQKLARLLWKVDFKDIVLVDSVEDILMPVRKKVSRN